MRSPAASVLRPISISVAVAVTTTLMVFVFSYTFFPIAGIEVRGARMYPESEAWKAVPDRTSLLTLNTAALERKIEANPWIKGVEVSKNWQSDIVMLEVKERRPVLNGVLDGRRIILSADGKELPGLGGASLERVELQKDQVKDILKVGRVLQSNDLTLESIDGVGPGGVEATIEGRRVIFSGEIGSGRAEALKEIMDRHPGAPFFDLRSPERVVVGGRPDAEPVG